MRNTTKILEESKQQIIKYLLPKLKDDNIIITVHNPPELPSAGFVQVDFVIYGKNILSTNAENLINFGFRIPDTKKLLTLPSGQYKISDLKDRLSEGLLLEKHRRPDGKKARSFIAVFRYNPTIEVLLVSDKKGRWTMPGGQLDMKENYEDAAWRELKEETGVVPKDLIHWKKLESDDKITDIYYTVVPAEQKAQAGSDARGVKWFPMDKLDGVKNFHRIILNNLNNDIHDTKKELEESMNFLESIGISSKELLIERKRTIDGYLIVMEGIDGAGKSTQCDALEKWLHDRGWKVTVSKWNSSPHITDAIKKGKKERWLSPTLFSLLNASDMVWRFENIIKPALDKGHVVICDRFYYTSYVRDSLRGVSDALLNEIYKNFPEPDLVIHFLVPPELAMERLMRDKGVKYYSAGRDIGYHEDEEKCALEYEKKMDEVYRKILPKIKNYKAVNSDRKPSIVFKEIKSFVKDKLQKVKRSKFKNLIKEAIENNSLNERLSYSDLYDDTDDKRIDRARTVRVRPLLVTTENNNEMWKFSYTSAERSEYKKYGGRAGHKGNIHFFKDSIEPGDNAEDLDCMVDCDCRDFKFRWAYANAQDDASFIGGKSLNKAINRPPVKTNPERKTQLCKHLAGLAKYLTTNIDRARQRARLRNRPVNIFEDMDNLANKGKFAATYNDHENLNKDLYEYFCRPTTIEVPSVIINDDKKTLYENIEKVGHDPNEEYSDLPINWHAIDLSVGKGWDTNSVREFAGLKSDFTAIYPAILNTVDLDGSAEDVDDPVTWDEFRIQKGGYPPIVVLRDENGKVRVMDGNHRLIWAQNSGHQTIGAWVVDKLIQKDIDKQKKQKPLNETRIISPELSLEEGYITLYHGTTWAIALQAKKGELGPQNLKKLIIDVLTNVFHETPRKSVEIFEKYIGDKRKDSNFLFLTNNKQDAENYARSATKYGGEIFMDILSAYMWNYKNWPRESLDSVRNYLQTDEPAIVTINVPLSMVFTHPNWNTPYRDRIRDILKNVRKNPELRKHLDNLSMEVFVKEKIPAKFVQRIDRVEKFEKDK